MIEFREHLVLEVVQQIRREQPTRLPGVHEAIQLMNQHGTMLLELGDHRLVQGIELPGIHHEVQSTFDAYVSPGEKLSADEPRSYPQRVPSWSLKVVRPLSLAAKSSSIPSATSERIRTAWRRCAGTNGRDNTEIVTKTRSLISWNLTQRASTFKSLSTSAARDRPAMSCTTGAKSTTSWPSEEVRRKSIVDPTLMATSPSASRIGK